MCAGFTERGDGGYGRFLKKAPQKLLYGVAGLFGWYGFVKKDFLMGLCADI